MSTTFAVPIFLLILHFLGDFVLQSDWMAINKSKNWIALGIHCTVYSLVFAPFYGLTFAGITFATHFITDALTSRLTSKLFQAGERHWFFVAIGGDQLIHAITLALTLRLL